MVKAKNRSSSASELRSLMFGNFRKHFLLFHYVNYSPVYRIHKNPARYSSPPANVSFCHAETEAT